MIKGDTNFIQLGGSSLTAVHLLNDLEMTFKVQLPYLLDKVINETFKSCDQYLHGKIYSGDFDTVATESDVRNSPINDRSNKRKCDDVVSDMSDSFKSKVPHIRSSFIYTISKGNQYMKCKSVFYRDDHLKPKTVVFGNYMNEVELFKMVRTTDGNPSLCPKENSVMNKSLGKSKNQLNSIPAKHSRIKSDKSRDCENECPTFKDNQENYEDLLGNFLPSITDTEEELSTTDIVLHLEEDWKFDTGKCVDASPLVAVSR